MRHIRNRDPDDMTAFVLRVRIRLRIAGVVVVARIMRINRHKRQLTQIFAPFEPRRFHRIRLRYHSVRKTIRNAMLVDRNQAHSPRRRRVAQAVDNPRLGQAHARLGANISPLHKFAVLRSVHRARVNGPFLLLALVDRKDTPPVRASTVNPEHKRRVRPDAANKTALIGIGLARHLRQPRKNLITRTKSWVRRLRDHHDFGHLALALPLQRLSHQVPVSGRPGHTQNRHRRKLVTVAVSLFAPLQMPFVFELFHDALKVNPPRAFDAKSFGNITLCSLGRVLGNPCKDFLFRRELVHGSPAIMPLWGREYLPSLHKLPNAPSGARRLI